MGKKEYVGKQIYLLLKIFNTLRVRLRDTKLKRIDIFKIKFVQQNLNFKKESRLNFWLHDNVKYYMERHKTIVLFLLVKYNCKHQLIRIRNWINVALFTALINFRFIPLLCIEFSSFLIRLCAFCFVCFTSNFTLNIYCYLSMCGICGKYPSCKLYRKV